MINCKEVLKLLYEYIDKQLDEYSQSQIEEHIKLCRYCRRHHEFEIELQKIVKKSCFEKNAPSLLKSKIKDMLTDCSASE